MHFRIKQNIMKVKLFILVLFFTCSVKVSIGQSSINTMGNSQITSSGSISFSIGQMMTKSDLQPNGQMFHGVQIARETTLNINKIQSRAFTAFPNPVVGALKIDGLGANESFAYELVSMSGNVVKSGLLNSSNSLISTEELTAGVFLLSIVGTDSKTSFKIFKK